jgi:predicted neuraminidase
MAGFIAAAILTFLSAGRTIPIGNGRAPAAVFVRTALPLDSINPRTLQPIVRTHPLAAAQSGGTIGEREMNLLRTPRLLIRVMTAAILSHATFAAVLAAEKPFLTSELIFPLEHWHNHGSCIVEAPNGDLLVCWFHGSGERTADDVKIEGARLRQGAKTWSPRFTMADTPGYPDTNCCMFFDPDNRLWLMWPTILANRWESALMKYRISSNYAGEGSPKWEVNEVMHVTPGPEFEAAVSGFADRTAAAIDKATLGAEPGQRIDAWLASLRTQAADKLTRRIGWFTRAHPLVLEGRRLIVPLYSDGFSFSLMNISDDWGATWHTSAPIIGAGNIQPSIVQRKDGSLYALMRDNGPPPKRLMQSESRDRGETWSLVTDTDIANPGSGAEIISLRNGRWMLIGNDLERGRHRLTVRISDDEGKSWKWQRAIEFAADESGRFHYPSIMQAKDGTLHASYSYFLEKNFEHDADGKPRSKSIKHAHFNEEWVMETTEAGKP